MDNEKLKKALHKLYCDCHWDLRAYYKLHQICTDDDDGLKYIYVKNKWYKKDIKFKMIVDLIGNTPYGKLWNIEMIQIIVFYGVELLNVQQLENARLNHWQNEMNNLKDGWGEEFSEDIDYGECQSTAKH